MPKTKQQSGQITLAELKHLLEIYHGTKTTELNSSIIVNSRRVNGNAIEVKQVDNSAIVQMDFVSELINPLEQLIIQCELAGYTPEQIISGKKRELLVEIIRPYMIGKITPEELLCKRIATYLQEGLPYSFRYTTEERSEVLYFILMGLIYRFCNLDKDDYAPLGYNALFITVFSFLQMVTRRYFAFQHGRNYIKQFKHPEIPVELEIQTNLQLACDEYSKQSGLTNLPHLFLDDNKRSVASTFIHSFPEAPGGYIRISKSCVKLLDIEEIYGVLAHEVGHLVNFQNNYSEDLHKFADFSSIIASLSSKFLFQLLNHFCSNNEKIFGNNSEALFIVVCVAYIAKRMNHDHEFKSDQTSAKLRGPLSLSSGLRSLTLSHKGHPFTLFKPAQALLKLTHYMGLNDVFSSHPNTRTRITALMDTKQNNIAKITKRQ